MLNQKRSGKIARLKYLLALPVCGALLCASTLGFSKNYGWIAIGPVQQDTVKYIPPPPPPMPPLKGSGNLNKTLKLKIRPMITRDTNTANDMTPPPPPPLPPRHLKATVQQLAVAPTTSADAKVNPSDMPAPKVSVSALRLSADIKGNSSDAPAPEISADVKACKSSAAAPANERFPRLLYIYR